MLHLVDHARRVLRRTPARERLLRAILARPGLSLSEAAREAAVSLATAAYHVKRLRELGSVDELPHGRRRLLFPAEASADVREARADLALLEEPAARRLASAILDAGGAPRAQIAARVPDSARAVYHHLKRFRDAGLIVCDPPRRYHHVVATARLVRAMAALDQVK